MTRATSSSGFIKPTFPKRWTRGCSPAPDCAGYCPHHDEDSECFSLQFEVKDSAKLHEWYVKKGEALNGELQKVFKDKVAGFSTLMEVIEGD